jgi:3-hydroxybutyryl-CoA dehydrogenase
MEFREAAVIGGGTMGAGIAHVLALSGIKTALVEADAAALNRALQTIEKNLERQAAKKTISPEDKAAALKRLAGSLDLNGARAAQIAIEAVPEKAALKKSVIAKLAAVMSQDAILATNTSSIPITEIAAAASRPERVVGLHFMNPVPLMKLVEIVRGLQTSDETCGAATELAKRLGKTPVLSNDFPGFISNRILMPMINEACFAFMEGVGTREGIDTVMKLGMNHPMGPLELADYIGLDVCLAIMETLYSGFGDPKYRPCPLLKSMVAAGRLGKKSGKGFYDYPAKP